MKLCKVFMMGITCKEKKQSPKLDNDFHAMEAKREAILVLHKHWRGPGPDPP
jgi:hypothetical protein